MKKINTKQAIVLGAGIVLIILIVLFTGRDTTNNRELAGYIASVSNDSITIDEIEFLTGDDAEEKAIEDTDCESDRIKECVPSLNSGFYIRNTDTERTKYMVSPEVEIGLINKDTLNASTTAFVAFRKIFGNTALAIDRLPFSITIQDNVVQKIELQQLP